MNFTQKVRCVALIAFALGVLVALAGWLLERDPNQLMGVLGIIVAAMGVGEASNVGKRMSFKREAVDAERLVGVGSNDA